MILAGTFHGVHAISRQLCPPDALNPTVASAAPHIFGDTTNQSSTNLLSSQFGTGAGGGGVGGQLSNNTAASNNNNNPVIGPQRKARASGITSLESSHIRLTVFETPTGTKFLLFTSPEQINVEGIAKKCYELYAVHVMANPFYNLEMPIRVDKFEREVGLFLGKGST